ncbi:MAG: glucokinase [Syntrophales bacterium]
MLLAGDIGATKTVLAVYSPESGPRNPLIEEEVRTTDFSGIEAILTDFLKTKNVSVERACFGIAAPVTGGEARMINLPWIASARDLEKKLNIRHVHFMNDLEAIANAIPLLTSDDILTLNEGVQVVGGAIAVIAPGTGLGEAFLTWDGTRYRSHASEGGHVDFAPGNPLEIDLLTYLNKKYEHVSYERVCSGPGIYNIYCFLKDKQYAAEPPWLAARLAEAADPTPAIVSAAVDESEKCKLSEMTMDIFTSILGAEAGNLALKVMSTGGVYLAGGIPPRITGILKEGKFIQSFCNKGRESFLMADIPVHIILNIRSALMGAAARGLEMD